MSQLTVETVKSVRQGSARSRLEVYGPVLALLALFVVTAVLEWLLRGQTNFIKPENLLNILRQGSFMGIVALGMTFVIILGGIDLSVGSLVAFAGGLGIWLMNTAIQASSMIAEMARARTLELDVLPYSELRVWLAQQCVKLGIAGSEPWGLAIAIGAILLVGTLCGWLNGLLVAKGRLAPFIATLGGFAAYRSLSLAIADGGEYRSASTKLFRYVGTQGIPLPMPKSLLNFAHAMGLPDWVLERSPGVPHSLWYPILAFVALAILGHILLNKTRYGRYVKAIGCNERAAVYSAINVDRVKILTYTLIGAACGVAALLVASRMNSVSSSNTATMYELDAIAAVAIGGTRMSGGSGRVWGTVVGVLILSIIGNMLNILNVSPYLQGFVKGVIIITAALMQRSSRSAA